VFAWVALAPLMVALLDARIRRPGRAFVLGLATGGVYFAITVYWTSGVMAQYGGLQTWMAVAIAGLLVAYLALFPALFAAAMSALIGHFGRRALLLAPAVWVSTEYAGRTILFGGFPWALLGYSQVTVLPVAQLASIVGVFGLSALIVWVGTALAWAVIERNRASLIALASAAVLVTGVSLWGAARLASAELLHEGTPITVGVVQGNIAQDQKWDAAYEDAILAKYLRLSAEAVNQGATFILWPESAVPFYFESDAKSERIREFARTHHTSLLIGGDQYRPGSPPLSYNAAFMVRPDGTTASVYRKVHLVPFGEYVPAKRMLFFAAPLVEAVSDFAPGDAPVTLPLASSRISTAICYEVVYPSLIREGVGLGSRLLTTITNDAWFGRSSAPFQHFEMASMRAIENGRYLARAANTGVSGFVDPYGHVLARSDLFVDRVLVARLRLLDVSTVYARIGDLVAYLSLVVTIAALGAAVVARPKGQLRGSRAR
jgi:apolipoprotein N-acyltransferase